MQRATGSAAPRWSGDSCRYDAPNSVSSSEDAVAASPAPAAPSRAQRGPPCLWFTRLPLHELLEAIRALHFPELPAARAPRLQFANCGRLAELEEGGGAATLTLHQVLNQATTPAEVFGTLFKRALGRLLARATVGPRFFTICPEEPFAEAWLDHHLGACLVRRADAGAGNEPEVGARWRALWLAPRAPAPRLALARTLADAELARLLRQLG